VERRSRSATARRATGVKDVGCAVPSRELNSEAQTMPCGKERQFEACGKIVATNGSSSTGRRKT